MNVLERNISSSVEPLRVLGVGCSSGDIDYDLVARLLTRFPKISNTVLEPTDTFTDYESLVKEKPLSGVEWNFRQQKFDSYYQSILETSEAWKFHFISAIAVLYYMQNWQTEIMNMYNLLETGGVLMITLMSEESGFWRVAKRFPMMADHLNVQINSENVKTFLREEMIDFEVVKQRSFVDITCCTIDGDEDGSMLVDFITHVKHFKTTAPLKLQADFLEYFFSNECCQKSKDRLFLNNSIEAIIVRKR
ncbi:Histamine N-methyltransferase [Holothuria leucospilota]|uniref:Histamine N-methyltransferase n=1 Tax=Holothuria leucospilota TaxID=206669 RepID=A0A9Q0YID7_HOLLE|nr:Histamine N-methyltransferase [Holothuria leucospilota]